MSANVSDLRRGIQHDLRELTAPLVRQLETIDGLIAERVSDLAELRAVRAELVRSLRPLIGEDAIPIEPGRNSKPGPKLGSRRNGKKPSGGYESTQVGDDTIERVLAFVREHFPDGEFTGTDVLRSWKQEGDNPSENSIRASLARLRDREQIRFVKKGRAGSTLYAVV